MSVNQCVSLVRKKSHHLVALLLLAMCLQINIMLLQEKLLKSSRNTENYHNKIIIKNLIEKRDARLVKIDHQELVNYQSIDEKSFYKFDLPALYLINKPAEKIAGQFLNEPVIQTTDNKYFAVFFIKSSCSRRAFRQIVRVTYGSVNSINNHRFAFIFLIGKTNASCQKLLDAEIRKHGDILQPDVKDDYNSLPEKVLSAYQWVFYHKKNLSTFYSFTDDDCAVNVVNFYDYFVKNLLESIEKQKIFCGYHFTSGQKPSRDPRSKYYTPLEIYSKPLFPPYCNGGLTTIAEKTLENLYQMAEVTHRGGIILEDVFITGILRVKFSNGVNNIENLPEKLLDQFAVHMGESLNAKLLMVLYWRKQAEQIHFSSINITKFFQNFYSKYDIQNYKPGSKRHEIFLPSLAELLQNNINVLNEVGKAD